MRSWAPVVGLLAMAALGLFVKFDRNGMVNWALIGGALLGAAALGLYWKRSP